MVKSGSIMSLHLLPVFSLTLKSRHTWYIVKNSRSEELGNTFSPTMSTSGHPFQCPVASLDKERVCLLRTLPRQHCKNHRGPPNSLAQKTHHNAQGAPRALPGSCPLPLVPFQSPAFQLSAAVGRKNTLSPETLQSMPLAKWTHPSKALPPQNDILIPPFARYPLPILIKTYPLPLDRGACIRPNTACPCLLT